MSFPVRPGRKPRLIKQIPKPTRKIISYDEIIAIIDNIFICNYWEKKIGRSRLVGLEQFNKWKGYFDSIQTHNLDIPRLSSDIFPTNGNFVNIGQEKLPYIINELLLIGEGKISLCGGALVSIFQDSYIEDYDIFFHCQSVDEADKILNDCCVYIENNNYRVTYKRSQGVLTVEIANMKIQFIRRVYQGKDQILLGFDMAGCRLGYNPIDGFFATICGALAVCMKSFPLDITQRSMSFKHRLEKYTGKGFSILLPGLPIHLDKDIKTADGRLLYNSKDKSHKFKSKYDDNYNRIHDTEYEDKDEEEFNDSDYEGIWSNWYIISKERFHNVTFESENYDEICNLPDELVKKSINQGTLFRIRASEMTMKAKTVYNFMGDNYNEYNVTRYVKGNKRLADKLWKERCDYYIEKAKDCAKLCIEEPWKYKNPESQSFGKFSPIIENPRKWYGEHYQSVEVGLKMDKFQALMDCRKNIYYINNVPTEIFKIICEYWLKAEVDLARDKLYALI